MKQNNIEDNSGKTQENNTKVACVISAAGGTGNTAISISIANNMVFKNKKTLYINAEKFESYEMYIDGYNGIVYKNIIGLLKERDNKKIIEAFNDTVIKSDDMSIYALHDDIKDIDSLDGTDITYFLDVIKSMNVYEYIILDFKMAEVQNSRDILKNADDIIMISDGRDIVNLKTDRALKLIRYQDEMEKERVIEKVKMLYNRFINNKSNTLQCPDIQTAGGIPLFRIGKEKSYVDYFIGDNSAISRSHANILTKEDKYYIIDTNSTNHTFIEGQMIPPNKEIQLASGQMIKLANEEFEFHIG